jgi:HTH-type transcriptional regulator / antitoxin MqsA
MRKSQITKEHCPVCGEKSCYRDIRAMEYEYKQQKIVVQQPGLWCDACGEGIIDGKDSKATQRELQEFKAKTDGLLTPDQIRGVRKKLHLKQVEAGEIFGGGPNAFSRYETGALPAPKSLDLLFKVLDNNPEIFFSDIRPMGGEQPTDHYPRA